MTDMVNHPPHYNSYSVEVIEVTRHQTFNIGNAIKYILRHPFKGASQQDLEKAMWYLGDHVRNFGYEVKMSKDSMANLAALALDYMDNEGAFTEVYDAIRMLLWGDANAAANWIEQALNRHF